MSDAPRAWTELPVIRAGVRLGGLRLLRHSMADPAMTTAAPAPAGIRAFDVSSRFVDDGSVVEAGLTDVGLSGFIPDDPSPGEPPPPEKEPAGWIVAATDPTVIDELRSLVGGCGIEAPEGIRPWTDDYSDLLSVIRW